MTTAIPTIASGTADRDPGTRWVGYDDRGVELEIVAVLMPDGACVVIHVMPTHYRKGNDHG